MSKTLADFTINDPNNMNLKNVIAFNDSDYYYRQFNRDIPDKTCSNLFDTWNIKTLEKTNDTVKDIVDDFSKTPCDSTNIESCYKKSLCYNAALHSQIKYLTGIKASDAKDVNYMDINKQYNFNVITAVNLSFGLVMLMLSTYKYYG